MFIVLAALQPGTIALVILLLLLVFALIIALSSIRIVRQTQALVIERLGRYYTTWNTGLHWLVPFIDRVSKVVVLKEIVNDYAPQPVITKDNVTMQIDTVVYYQITDPKAFTYGVDNPNRALETLTATTLRNIIGALDLDEALTSRELINSKMRIILDEATDPWGIKVIRVELKNIIPPKDIREAMEKQMRAEREKRQSILIAEGERQSAILKAEGFKESQILEAQAQKESAILRAEGEANAILKVQEATAKGIEMIKKAGADQSVLTLKAYDALVEVSKGQATKLIIPSELQGLAGLAVTAKEFFKDDNKSTK
ncbi:SPFH/Band 7/PHB domain protein [Acholeplasma vituli]|uniref:SPFH/Band 7/PHB domain protein n=1 Tax=Paracholeplasma vituli TaxID=69473 RepID=A0ABT2PXW3_9MOLU|nr:SPFH domain-containing protein [Paracholeplasma vituli]MCU0104567.1 SPFH/Band 7/PHB domain protein [Paracholeplasma vituli]